VQVCGAGVARSKPTTGQPKVTTFWSKPTTFQSKVTTF